MGNTFSEVKLFQVKPDKLDQFEELIKTVSTEQNKQPGSISIKYMKRFYTMDGSIKDGLPPRELTRIVKCVKYFSYWEFDTKDNYGKATGWFFEKYGKDIMKLLLMPFDINCGDTI
ncbi:MAG: hypothetical protein GF372_12735 [Candidatus Marinimicrobia bacterium]|nr:hypothetical protein [Candidatus Neomarinimicrobiota bacterium]